MTAAQETAALVRSTLADLGLSKAKQEEGLRLMADEVRRMAEPPA